MRCRLVALVSLAVALIVGCQSAPVPSESPSVATAPASVSTTSAHLGEDVTVGAYEVGGTLITPGADGKIAVVLLAGSGPSDRDETLPSGSKPLRDIAEALAGYGIASLRFDKRSLAAPSSLDSASFTIRDEYLDDAAAAIALLRQRFPDSALFVIGHSQGAMVLPTVLSENPGVAGGISLSGTPRSLWQVVRDQNVAALETDTSLSAEDRENSIAQADELAAQMEAIDSPDDTVPPPYNQAVGAAYVASLNGLDTAGTAQTLQVPLLFLQGDADKQVYADIDYAQWQEILAGRENVTFQLFPGLNHYFWQSTGTTAQDDLSTPGTVDPEVTSAISHWLDSHA